MGWTFFACFGCTKKRKRPISKRASKTRRRIRGYEPLESDIHTKELDVSQPLSSTTSEKTKDEKKPSIKKKVRFNLEVVTYEPLSLQDDEHVTSWEETGDVETDQTAATAEEACLNYAPLSKTFTTESKMSLYSSDYRYNSCYDGEDEYEYDEDDDDDESQISDEDDDYDDVGCMIDPQSMYCEQIMEELDNCSSMPLISSEINARLRSHYIVPVLNPIENLSQWKAVKTKKC
ncbi:hypothetical protein BVRB_3g048400 [Beta vulgaris subsp. vulgaris]|nr:hypothetical protein BVRB_3g048400 [Beta vulgaris subsp. vulgaris]